MNPEKVLYGGDRRNSSLCDYGSLEPPKQEAPLAQSMSTQTSQEFVSAAEFVPTGRCYMLCEAGDLVLEWSAEHEDAMRKLIEAKIKEGYSFFLVKKVFGIERNVKVRSIDQIKVGAKLLLKDDDALRLFEAGGVRVGAPDSSRLETERMTSDPDEIVKNECVAVRPIAAG